MRINSLENASKHFIQKVCPERVASCARLKIRGSEKQREKLKVELNDTFSKIIKESFDKKIKEKQKPSLNHQEILDCIKQILPTINIRVGKERQAGINGGVKTLLDSTKKVVGFALKLKSDVKKGKNEETLRHEMNHILDFVTQPKTLARYNTDSLVGKLANYNENRDLTHFAFYSKYLYMPKTRKSDEQEIKFLAKKINEHFEKLKAPPEEKIEILQNWRYSLKAEKNAYWDEANYMYKENPKQYLLVSYGDFLHEPKIKLVEKFLKDEITAVRQESAKKYGN